MGAEHARQAPAARRQDGDGGARRREAQPVAQTRMRVGASNDAAEREADAVMRRVVDSIAAGRTETDQRVSAVAPVVGRITRVRRSGGGDTGRIGADGGQLDRDTESMLRSRIGRGRALDESVRRTMEPRFGQDFSGVRVHDDAPARELNARMSAEAFTVGNDIFFSGQAPDAGARGGQQLLAHELTHVVQQQAAPARRVAQSTDGADHRKRMTPSGNPKADPPARVGSGDGEEVEAEVEDGETEQEESVVDRRFAEGKVKQVRALVGEYRRSHDRVHAKKKARVASRRRHRTTKVKRKGAIAIGASNAARGIERGANRAKHGLLNAGRTVGRALGASVNPGTSVTMQVGSNTTDTASGAYGAVDTEKIETRFTVKLVGDTWVPVVTHLKGTYGKITSPLPAGLTEITGPHKKKSRRQIKDLLQLDGQDFYMVKAVDAHESVHEDHIHDALNDVGGDIAQEFAAITVDKTTAPTAKEAIAHIKTLPEYEALVNSADPNDSQIRDTWDAKYVELIDRDHFGPTQDAEADVVEPMVDKINSWRKKKKWKKVPKTWTCTDDDGAVRIPKGRTNP